MSLTPAQKAEGWIEWNGGEDCPIFDARTLHSVTFNTGRTLYRVQKAYDWRWENVTAYRIIEAHGADAEPARPTPFPDSYADLVFDDQNWSQTIIVDGKRPEWLRDDDRFKCTDHSSVRSGWVADPPWFAIRVRRREPKRETVIWTTVTPKTARLVRLSVELVDDEPDLSTIKIEEGGA